MKLKSLLSVTALLLISLQLLAQTSTTSKIKPELIYNCDKSEPKLRLSIVDNTYYYVSSLDDSKNTIEIKMSFDQKDIKGISVLKRSQDIRWRKIASKFPKIEPKLTQIMLISTK